MTIASPSQYLPVTPESFIGKTSRIARLLHLKADSLEPDATAKWMFCGPPGTGKSRLAQVLAARISHHSTAVEQLNGQSLTVDRVRDWERSLCYRPIAGERNVKLVDEIDCASTAAQNELRTYLDGIKNGTVILATTNKEPDELPKQLQSRFQIFRFEPIRPVDFATFMRDVFQFDFARALDICSKNQGCVRSALLDVESAMDAAAMEEEP